MKFVLNSKNLGEIMFHFKRFVQVLSLTLFITAIGYITVNSYAIEEKVNVKVCWRAVPSSNPSGYGLKLRKFSCSGKLRTVKGEWGSGTINGRQIYNYVKRSLRSRFTKIWVVNATDGIIPETGSSTVKVSYNKEDNYDSYITLDTNGEYVLYLHVGKKVKKFLTPKKKEK